MTRALIAFLLWSLTAVAAPAQLQLTGAGTVDSFTPAAVPGLAFAVRPDLGVTTGGANVTAVAGAWGTPISLTCTGGVTLSSSTGPLNQNLFRPTASGSPICNFSASFTSSTYTAVFVIAMQDITAIRAIFGKQGGAGATFIATGASAQTLVNNMRMRVGSGTIIQQQMTLASFTGAISGTTLTASGVSGAIQVGQTISGTGVTNNTSITGFLSGTGGAGTYTVNNSQSVGSEAMTVNGGFNKNLGVAIVKYDGVNSAAVSMNGVSLGTITGLGAATATFDQIFATGNTTFGDYFLGPAMLYNRQTTATEDAALVSYLSSWIGSPIWISAGGSDSTPIPWKQPGFQTLAKAMAFDLYGGLTVAPRGGEIIHLGATQQSSVAGISASRPSVLDGGLWGTGLAELRGSVAPSCSVSFLFAYDCGVVATPPGWRVLYLPGGIINFGPNFSLGSMQQLVVQTITTCSDTTSGHWGLTAGNHLCVNAGTTINPLEIEYAPAASGWHIAAPLPNYVYRNLAMTITTNGCTSGANSNTTFFNLRCYFPDDDGLDAAPGASLLNFVIQSSIVAYAGIGYVGLGGAAGDCYAIHGFSTAVQLINNQGWWCGKTGMSIQNTSTVTATGNLMVAGLPYYTQQFSIPDGSYTLISNVGVVPSAAVLQSGIQNNSTSMTMTSWFNTLYSQSGGTLGTGASQTGSGGSLVLKNTIVSGFLTGETFAGAGTFTASNNDLFNNGTNYGSGTSAAPGDISANPLFVDPSNFNFAVPQNSPVIGAGVAIPGVTVDYNGKPRPNPPSIGAFNFLLERDLSPASNDDSPAFLDRAA